MSLSRRLSRSMAPLLAALFGAFAASVALAWDGDGLKFEVFKDKAGEFRWSLKAANGATLATAGQGYKAKADATRGVDLVKKSGTDAKLKYEFYEDTKQEHRWRLKAGNGQTVAASSEGYKAKVDAERTVELIKAGAAKAEVTELKE